MCVCWFYYLSTNIPECVDMEHVQSISLVESCYDGTVHTNTVTPET